jgi:hypothetical protein
MKASPEISELQLYFNFRLQTSILDASFDAIFILDQITTLYLLWNRMSLDKIKYSLRKQRGKKRWERVALGNIDHAMNDDDILEICFYLPSLIEWTVASPRSTITVDGARKWKRICPDLETVHFLGGGLPEEVEEVLQGLGVTVK